MRVLVTGGAGYIGSHTAKLLADRGYEPLVLDDLRTGHGWAVKWGPLVRGDVEDRAALAEAFGHEPGAVIHFAGSAYVGESMERPAEYFRNNVGTTIALLEATLAAGPIPFVFSSTCASYGLPERVPIVESAPQQPVNPYGESKLFVEKMLGWHGRLLGLPWMALRYFNAAGADPDGELGEVHDPETHLIPRVLVATANGQRAEIYGTDYPTPDGSAIRDYVHVTDLADAHVRALETLLAGGPSGAVNLGTGKGHSVRDVVDVAEDVTGARIERLERPRRAGDPPELVADPSQARELLGWKARHSDLASIVSTAWAWQRRRM